MHIRQGPHGTELTAVCGVVPPEPDVRKLFLVADGMYCPVGIPVPEQGQLVLRRCVSPSSFPSHPEKAILLPLDASAPGHTSPGWKECRDISVYFNLPACVPPFPGLICREAKAVRLAILLDPGAPFPGMAVFCFGTEVQIGQNRYLSFYCPRKE